MKMIAVCLALFLAAASAQPFLPGTGQLPLGNLRTSDMRGPNGGTYNLSLLSTQEAGIQAAVAFKGNYSDLDIVHFLTNVECLEGLFDTYGAFGRGFVGDLEMGGPIPNGGMKANMDQYYEAHMQEVALNEQGHAAFTRAAGSNLPCPAIDFTGGWNDFMAAAYNLPMGMTVEEMYGMEFNPFQDQQTFITCVLTLEELGATGNLGLTATLANPVIMAGVGGLATSATAQATVERMLLWQLRNETIAPFNETAQQVYARLSALVDSLDGPLFLSQGLVNTDPRTIAVPDTGVNMVPTDLYGLTFTRTPAQLINILTLGSANGTGAFFPEGLVGAITKPTGYATMASGVSDYPAANGAVTTQEATAALGTISPAISASGPMSVPNEAGLSQNLGGMLETASPNSRGLDLSAPASGPANMNPNFQFQMGVSAGPVATGGK